MSESILISFTNSEPGRDAEFNEWFDEHVREVLSVPGVVSARRFRLAAAQVPGATESAHQYFAIYEIDGDLEETLQQLWERRAGGLNVRKRGIADDETQIWAFEQFGETRTD
jgi:hypothetical protein